MADKKREGRVLLPSNVVPSNYDVRYHTVDLEKHRFVGEEEVQIEVVEEGTKSISLHSKFLYITAAAVSYTEEDGTQKKLEMISVKFDIKLEIASFEFEEALPVGNAIFSCSFEGELNNQMAGFYRSSYTDLEGKKKFMASTQFEALDARRAFPCWDEPALKATFDVSMTVLAQYTALSNMPESEVRFHADGTKTLKFMKTPIMSTYLLAFVVGEFDFVQCVTSNGVSIRVFVPLGDADKASFSMDVAKRCLDFYDDYFQIPYPLPKLDMVAMPEFAAGAMENWGLVTYRQVDLMIDSSKATVSQLQRVATVVTHELAHQWFGNLVTMQWWDDLWLNEGFACWMQTFSADALFPEWKLWDQFSIGDQSAALRLDALRSSHPIQVPIKHAKEVDQVFDAISYCKGACVIRMIHEVVGPKAFQIGLQNYLTKHKYGNTETTDLWNAWSESSGKPIGELMSSWTEQMGYPVLRVHSISIANGKTVVDVSQDWFLADGSSMEGDAAVTWSVPVLIRWEGMTGDSYQYMMKEKREKISFDRGNSGWVKLNAGQHVLARVVYTSEMLEDLAKAVKGKELSPEDRAALVLDAFACSQAGHVDVGDVVKLLCSYDSEVDDTVWSALNQVLGGLAAVIVEEPAVYEKFEALAAKMVLPAFSQLGWDDRPNDSDVTKSLRGTLISLVGKYSSKTPEIMEEASNRFARLMASPKDTTILAPESKIPTFQMVLKAGGEAEYNQLLAYYHLNEGDIAEQKLVFSSLGYAKEIELKLRTLHWAKNEIKIQDFFYPMAGVTRSGKDGATCAWEFFQENFDELKDKVKTANASIFTAVIAYCCGGFASLERADEIEAFFKQHPVPDSAQYISQMLERIRVSGNFLVKVRNSALMKDEFWSSL